MKPLDALDDAIARGLVGLVFDLDDTVLDDGELGLEAYEALFAMRASGLGLVASTGRPAGWAEVVARQWPIDLAVAENGAVALAKGGARLFGAEEDRAPLLAFARQLVARFPAAALASDNAARLSDVTIDVGETRRVPREEIASMRALAREEGLRTTVSSVHLHLSRSGDDKASGTLRAIARRFGADATTARVRWAFIGDSGNDAAAFAAFRTTFGVANVRPHLPSLTVPPSYVAEREKGAGFALVARKLVAARMRALLPADSIRR